AWHGAVIVVSHDRYFLDHVTTRTIEIAHQRGESYPGNYSKYVQLRAERLERWAKEFEAQQEYVARTEEFVRRYKAGQRSKEARGRQTMLDRLERIERPPVDSALKFRMKAQIESGQVALTTEKLVIGYEGAREGKVGAAVRVSLPDMQVQRGERIGLIGPNGSGKTTLLRTVVGQIRSLEGRLALGHNVQLGYYAQTHETLNPRLTVLDEIRHASTMSEESARTYLGRFLFSGDDVFKPVGALSGGERSRVALAKLTLQGANFLVLDEPTNHLDLPARQALEEVLSTYDGTLIFVSHDRYFVDALATTLWILEDGAITVHVGNYTAYRTRRSQPVPSAQPVEATPARAPVARHVASRASERAPSRSLEGVEADIAKLEAEVRQLEAELGAASSQADVDQIADLGAQYDLAQARLEQLYDEWQVLAS
ncbi:MAG TPA: ABC-F family ATP-binding cassette domain-containing protein, partial [Ktedonobacterales bacterium]|nr:ABC-F family ATP-binding cassette domain-containing protein [Ktedonobacterales bacterium]